MKGYVLRLCAASGLAFLALFAIAYAQRAARPIQLPQQEGEPPEEMQSLPAAGPDSGSTARSANQLEAQASHRAARERTDKSDPFARRQGNRKPMASKRSKAASRSADEPGLLPDAEASGLQIPPKRMADEGGSTSTVRLLGGETAGPQSPGEEDDLLDPSAEGAGDAEHEQATSVYAPPGGLQQVQPGTGASPTYVEPHAGRSARAARGRRLGEVSVEGTGRPGDPKLEGMQSPALSIEKTAPAEVQVGRAAVFEVRVRNVGNVPAHGVTVRDEVPRGARLVSTTPPASHGADGTLVWDLGTLAPGAEAAVEMEIVPTTEGELGSVALVSMQAQVSARSLCTRPQLAMEVSAAPRVLIGQQVTLAIKVSNPGTGAATGVVLTEYVPEGLSHPGGNELEYEIGELAPGETRQIDLVMKAAQAGKVSNLLVARGDGGLEVQQQTPIEVTAPALKLQVRGPRKRYLERQATYTLAISNPGTAPAHDITLVAYVPTGMEFVDANNAGQFDPATGTVHWSLDELPVQAEGTVTLTLLPTQPGDYTLRAEAGADLGLSAAAEGTTSVEGVAAMLLEVADISDPVEAGSETTYEIHVVNQGSKAAENVQVIAILPPQMKPLSAEGPTRHLFDGPQVRFAPLARLAPKADTMYRIRVQCMEPGDLRVRVQLLTDDIHEPVKEEESTRVYADE